MNNLSITIIVAMWHHYYSLVYFAYSGSVHLLARGNPTSGCIESSEVRGHFLPVTKLV